MEFIQLNYNWNADPNEDRLSIDQYGSNLLLSFLLNTFQYKQFEDGSYGHLLFINVSKYRLGNPNDEGFYRGQFRYNSSQVKWGEFYEVIYSDGFDASGDIIILPNTDKVVQRHFIFFFKDYTFECYADEYKVRVDTDISLYCPYCKSLLCYNGEYFVGKECNTPYSQKMSNALIAMEKLAEFNKKDIEFDGLTEFYCPKCKDRMYYNGKVECSCKSCGLHFNKRDFFQLVELNPHNKGTVGEDIT